MTIHPLAGTVAPNDILVDAGKLEQNYYAQRPDVTDPAQLVSFGTSGHRGSPDGATFTEAHILAITQAICDYRRQEGIDGPLFLGKDTHAASGPAARTALEVLAASGVETFLQHDDAPTPTPVISRAIIAHNRASGNGKADGIVVTPSHNPPADGGFKYNPPHGGPAGTETTGWIQNRANRLLLNGVERIARVPFAKALKAGTTHPHDYVSPYVKDLENVLDLDLVRAAGVKIGVDPLGGASVPYWEPIRDRYKLDITVVNPRLDPTFSFMTVDHDGKIRMDCSSPYAMAGLVAMKDQFQIAFGNDPDADRHGIVTPAAGLMNPNHYLAVAISYLIKNRPAWPSTAAIGKTLVSSSLIDRVAADLGRPLAEVPVGFKWFALGLSDGSFCFGGEESAGASFLRKDGSVWTTDKDGLIMDLLAAEITARTGKDPGQHYEEITNRLGRPFYTRVDVPATPAEKEGLKQITPDAVKAAELAGEPISAKLTRAPGNNAAIGGLKIVTENGWFAARPSGTENVCKIYAESFLSEDHLSRILKQAQQIVGETLSAAAK